MKKFKSSRLISICLVAILVYFAYLAIGQQKVIIEKKQKLSELQMKIEQELKINEELKKQKEAVNTPEYIEKTAREKLNMVKKNERVFVDIGQ